MIEITAPPRLGKSYPTPLTSSLSCHTNLDILLTMINRNEFMKYWNRIFS